MAQSESTRKEYNVYCVLYNNNSKIEWGCDDKKSTLLGDDGKELKFKTEAALLTYMGRRGWTLVSVWRMDSANLNTFYLTKTVTSDEQAKEGLVFKEDTKK